MIEIKIKNISTVETKWDQDQHFPKVQDQLESRMSQVLRLIKIEIENFSTVNTDVKNRVKIESLNQKPWRDPQA